MPQYEQPRATSTHRRVVEPNPQEVAFVSYVKEDERRAEGIYRELKHAGLPAWMDQYDVWPGQDRALQIRRALSRERLAFIACVSSFSVARYKSGHNEEIRIAINEAQQLQPNSRSLIPVRLDPCDIPSFDTGDRRLLSQLPVVDLFRNRAQGMASLKAIVRNILRFERAE